ncbi:uncharacterized protein [Littorina saxatilis]|uniref:Uncharacterized protein n=1 Tax=Littorina saxatilis TaxID=31220 RepID=A0AAN9GR35_9CAEN
MEGLHTLFVLCVFVSSLAGGRAWRESPLPVFKNVNVRTTNGLTLVSIRYSAPDHPKADWFIDGFPVPQYVTGYFTINSADEFALLSTSENGKPISVCLTLNVGKTCLYVRTQPPDLDQREDLDFPWPLIVPAPRVRYDEGRVTRLFVSQLNTAHTYNYTAVFYAKSPGHYSPLLKAESRDMEGGREGDLVTMAPVTSGSAGWMVSVATDRKEMEGVLLLNTVFTSTSGLVSTVTTSRPINIYSRQHTAPFPPGFLSTIPRDSLDLPWVCRDGTSCQITCPFVSNGDVTVTIARVINNDEVEQLPVVSVSGEMVRLGDYLGEARFTVLHFNRTESPGLFRCDIATSDDAHFYDVRV